MLKSKKITPTRKKANEKEVFTSKERDILIKEMERRIQNDPLNAVPLAIMLDFEIGVRCGELLALKESDIISENGTSKLYIHRQVVKENNNPEKYIESTIWTDSINPPAGYTYTGEYKTNRLECC